MGVVPTHQSALLKQRPQVRYLMDPKLSLSVELEAAPIQRFADMLYGLSFERLKALKRTRISYFCCATALNTEPHGIHKQSLHLQSNINVSEVRIWCGRTSRTDG